MKNLLITIIAISTLLTAESSFAQTNKQGRVTPAAIHNGIITPVVTLPVVDIYASKHTHQISGYTLPEVIITANRTPDDLYPTVRYYSQYIAFVNLQPVDILSTKKKTTLASLFSFKWLFGK